jgi:hypothetical protein
VNVLSWLSPLDLPDCETKPIAAMQFAITLTSLVQPIETHPQHSDQPNVNPHCDKINLEQTGDRDKHQPDALPNHFIKQFVYKPLSVSY